MSRVVFFYKFVITFSFIVIFGAFLSMVVNQSGCTGDPISGVGFFTKTVNEQGSALLKAKDDMDGFAIPYTVDSIPSFMNFLKNANQSGEKRNVVGSAVIVNTMLGYNNPGTGKWINNTNWQRLESALNQTKIIWDSNVVGCINRYYQENGDAAMYNTCSSEPGILFLGSDGGILYQLTRRTGSPIGDYVSIPLVYDTNNEETVGSAEETTVIMGSDKCRMAGVGINKAMISNFGYSIDNLNYDGLYSNTSNINTDIYTLHPAIEVDSVNGICYYF